MDTFESSGHAGIRAAVQLLSRPEGRISFTVEGSGPLLVLVPGMGDLRSTWRDVGPRLVEAGYRVATTDLRGHGDGDVSFAHHGDVATGGDLIALVEHLDHGPAVLVGNSMGAASAAWVAAERPDLVAGLVLVAPLLRNPAQHPALAAALHLLYRGLFVRPWGAAAWAAYYRSPLSRGAKAPWLDEHVAEIRASLSRPGRLRAFRHLALQLTHAPVEARLGEVSAPAIAFFGSLDPDFVDPAAELAWIEETIAAQGVWIPGVSHYPQHQAPEVVVPATTAFLAGLPRDGARWAPGPRA
ncbi:alpha/beta fold hydrolase [Pengzhenrongella sicca]|uniref:Alpha/beta hydrolase n=1 Tax=Pengzhenrongella sicca TaxID=2819238 RepID=A0A8A4ZD95_9MICO|nr:alpha/beta hydrolase [Pengzhenrongella sicca]QTE28863.1 alpha/beta hydrolase [Pengzhenrongella sicca]